MRTTQKLRLALAAVAFLFISVGGSHAFAREDEPNPSDRGDRAIAAESDFEPQFRNYLWAIRQADGVGHPEMLAFGQACATCGRFDTEVPTKFNFAVTEVASELDDWAPLYENPQIASLLIQTRQKRLEKAADGRWAGEQYSQLALEAWLTGDYAMASASLGKLRTGNGIPLLDQAARQFAERLDLPVARRSLFSHFMIDYTPRRTSLTPS